MSYRALFLGSIGVLTETSDMQRRAFNLAFRDAGLDWTWEGAGYYALLRKPGGLGRIMDYAAARGARVNAAEIHARKLHHFRELALAEGLALRPGVADTIAAARAEGMAVGFVSTTVPETIELIFDGLRGALTREDFDVVIDRAKVVVGKPGPECYLAALAALGLTPDQALAFEDTPEAQSSALGAGVRCIAVPGFSSQTRVFDPQERVLTQMRPDLVVPQRLSA
ncbi:MAG: HAD-IA family hydrolase [Pseudomonadota bacterium]